MFLRCWSEPASARCTGPVRLWSHWKHPLVLRVEDFALCPATAVSCILKVSVMFDFEPVKGSQWASLHAVMGSKTYG